MSAGPSLFDIRQWRGSQQAAFEELCFQLRDADPPKARSIKPGSPDRGVDWYTLTPDGQRLGRQCKFVPSVNEFLAQARKSLVTALKELPDLTEMEFWVPFDLPEATPPSRTGGTKRSARQRWDDAVSGWRQSLDGAQNLTIELIDGPTVLQRLTRDEHRGRLWFFFDKELFGPTWCRTHLDRVKDFVEERYRPDLHVDLPVARLLDGLAVTDAFLADIGDAQRTVLTALSRLAHTALAYVPESLGLGEAVKAFETEASKLPWRAGRQIADPPIARALEAARALGPVIDAASDHCWATEDELPPRPGHQDDRKQALAYLGTSGQALSRYKSLLESLPASAASSRALVLHGDAGEGKTHLLCDAAERLLEAGQPVVILLGGHFPPTSVWTSVAAELGIKDRGYEQLLGAMDAAAQASGKRFVVMVDALNEAPDPTFWQGQLDVLRVHSKATASVALVASCRTTYLPTVGLDETTNCPWTYARHQGLAGRESEAAARYFAHYGVEAPRIPLLHPDLTNPLFLKLYCEGLRDGVSPRDGVDSTRAIFNRLVANKARRIDHRLDLDPADNVTQGAVEAFAASLIAAGTSSISLSAAKALFAQLLPSRDRHPKTLAHQLLDSGLLTRDIVHAGAASEEVVRFTYNRFSDHAIASRLLADHVTTRTPSEAFKPGGTIRRWAEAGNAGVIEALSNSLPERFGLELVDALGATDDERPYRRWILRMFLNALPHRDPEAITDRTLELLNECATDPRSSAVFDLLVLLAPNPEHPLGGSLLDRNLRRAGPMSRRNSSRWGHHLLGAGERTDGVARLLRWAEQGPYPDYDTKVIESACVPLVWLLSTPSRPTRDHATKALAHVLQHHLQAAAALVQRFADADDLAIVERLSVACHGAVLRGGYRNPKAARAVFDAMRAAWLQPDAPIRDPLTRDSCRGVAEWLAAHDCATAVEVRDVTPPLATPRLANPASLATLEAKYPSIPYNEPEVGYEVLWRAIRGAMGDHLRRTIMLTVDEFFPRRGSGARRTFGSKEWVERWLFQRAIALGWNPERFSQDQYRSRGPNGRATHEGYADKYVAIARRELLARLIDHRPMTPDYGQIERQYAGPWELRLREVDPTLPPSRTDDLDYDTVFDQPFALDSQTAWWVGHEPGWAPEDQVPADWGARTHDLPDLEACLLPVDSGGTRWVRLEGHTGFAEPRSATHPEPQSSIAGRDLGFSVQAMLTDRTNLDHVLQTYRECELDANPAVGLHEQTYFGEAPWAAIAQTPYWTWTDEPERGPRLPAPALLVSADWDWHAEAADASLPGTVIRSVPARDLWTAGRLTWRGTDPVWHAGEKPVMQSRRSTGIYRDIQSALLAEEKWLAEVLQLQSWALVIKIVGEKHLYSDEDTYRAGIDSWLIYGAAVGFDGTNWDFGDWRARSHLPGRISIEEGEPVRPVAARAGSRSDPLV